MFKLKLYIIAPILLTLPTTLKQALLLPDAPQHKYLQNAVYPTAMSVPKASIIPNMTIDSPPQPMGSTALLPAWTWWFWAPTQAEPHRLCPLLLLYLTQRRALQARPRCGMCRNTSAPPLDPLSGRRTFGLCPLFDCCDSRCCARGCADVCSSPCFHFFWAEAQQWHCWVFLFLTF